MEENDVKQTPVEEARELLDQIQKANREQAQLLQKREKFMAEDILGGKSSAGKETPQPKEETPKEYAARVLRGEL